MADNRALAAQLKDAGNVLFNERKYAEAIDKYSQAIALDESNSVFWSNRAACRVHLRKFLDAGADASKATQLNPNSARAWGLFAEVSAELGDLAKSVNAFEKAISAASAPTATETERRLCPRYRAALEEVKRTKAGNGDRNAGPHRDNVEPRTFDTKDHSDRPWYRALSLLSQAPNDPDAPIYPSSAVILGSAYEAFQTGMQIMSQQYLATDPDMPRHYHGKPGAIHSLVNAITIDERIIDIAIMDDAFWKASNEQVILEVSYADAFTQGGPDTVFEKVQERLGQSAEADREKVWKALAATVYCWIFHGFRLWRVRGEHAAGVEMFRSAIALIERGNQTWAAVPVQTRGKIFSTSFLLGLKSLFMRAYAEGLREYKDRRYTFPELRQMSQGILDYLDQNPSALDNEEYSPVFVASFLSAVKGRCHSMLAECWQMEAILATLSNPPDFWRFQEYAQKSLASYEAAAEVCPKDDEYHSHYLLIALTCHWKLRSPLSLTVPLMAKWRISLNLAKAIWEHSFNSIRWDGTNTKVLNFEQDVLQKLQAGTVSESDVLELDLESA